MVPLWILIGGGFVGMFITYIIFTTCAFSGWAPAAIFWAITWPLGFITGWLVYLCYNLEQQEVDLYMQPWSVVFILIWIFYAFGIGVCVFY